jgi:hypothetical protein
MLPYGQWELSTGCKDAASKVRSVIARSANSGRVFVGYVLRWKLAARVYCPPAH